MFWRLGKPSIREVISFSQTLLAIKQMENDDTYKPTPDIVRDELRNAVIWIDKKEKQLFQKEKELEIREKKMKTIKSEWKDPITFDVGDLLNTNLELIFRRRNCS